MKPGNLQLELIQIATPSDVEKWVDAFCTEHGILPPPRTLTVAYELEEDLPPLSFKGTIPNTRSRQYALANTLRDYAQQLDEAITALDSFKEKLISRYTNLYNGDTVTRETVLTCVKNLFEAYPGQLFRIAPTAAVNKTHVGKLAIKYGPLTANNNPYGQVFVGCPGLLIIGLVSSGAALRAAMFPARLTDDFRQITHPNHMTDYVCMGEAQSAWNSAMSRADLVSAVDLTLAVLSDISERHERQNRLSDDWSRESCNCRPNKKFVLCIGCLSQGRFTSLCVARGTLGYCPSTAFLCRTPGCRGVVCSDCYTSRTCGVCSLSHHGVLYCPAVSRVCPDCDNLIPQKTLACPSCKLALYRFGISTSNRFQYYPAGAYSVFS